MMYAHTPLRKTDIILGKIFFMFPVSKSILSLSIGMTGKCLALYCNLLVLPRSMTVKTDFEKHFG